MEAAAQHWAEDGGGDEWRLLAYAPPATDKAREITNRPSKDLPTFGTHTKKLFW